MLFAATALMLLAQAAPPSITVPVAPQAPATAEQVATARAMADRLIAAAQAGDLFVNVTTGASAEVRHIRSGLVCGFDLGDRSANITIFPAGNVPRGDDVGCNSLVAGVTITTYATRYPTPVSAETIVRGTIPAIQQKFTDVKPYSGKGVTMEPQPKAGETPLPKAERLRLSATLNGHPVFTRIAAVACGPWIVSQRVTGPMEGDKPEDKALAADLTAEVFLVGSIQQVCAGQPPAPAPAPPPPAGTPTA